MKSTLEKLQPIIDAARQTSAARRVIVLDGKAASGKSTSAALLAQALDAVVVHMDDFFLPFELRSPARYAEAGGNVHYERFEAEVLCALRENRRISYSRFDCSRMLLLPPQTLEDKSTIIIEGCYAMHPRFGAYWDEAWFFDVEPEEQKRRIEKRGGKAALAAFTTRWIPLEENYFAVCKVREHAQGVIVL